MTKILGKQGTFQFSRSETWFESLHNMCTL